MISFLLDSATPFLILQQNLMNNFRIILISPSNVFVRLAVHNPHSASNLSPHLFKCIFNATKVFFKSWTLSRNLWNSDLCLQSWCRQILINYAGKLYLLAGTKSTIFKISPFVQFLSYKNFTVRKIHQNSTRNSMQPSDLA